MECRKIFVNTIIIFRILTVATPPIKNKIDRPGTIARMLIHLHNHDTSVFCVRQKNSAQIIITICSNLYRIGQWVK